MVHSDLGGPIGLTSMRSLVELVGKQEVINKLYSEALQISWSIGIPFDELLKILHSMDKELTANEEKPKA
jgi:hypothetical protein